MSVETKVYDNGYKSRIYVCLCDCGNTVKRNKHDVVHNRATSCGCGRIYKEIITYPEYVRIKLKSRDCSILLDLDDWEYFKNYPLKVDSQGYVVYRIDKKSKSVHRKVMNNPEGMRIDHIDRNKLDNRKQNLRTCSNVENCMNIGISKRNTSGYKGVRRAQRANRWEAYITVYGKKFYLGSFIKIEDAAKAREEAEVKYYGEFARQELTEKRNYSMNRNKFSKVSYDQYKKDCIRELITDEKLREEHIDLELPKRATERSAGYDFVSPFSFTLKAGETILLPTGIHAEIEKDKYLQLVPRSSLGFKHRLQFDNVNPVIDSDYFSALNEGHILVKLSNCSLNTNNTLIVNKGDKLFQGIISSYFLSEDDDMDYKVERTFGFGSTDKKNA